MKTMTYLLFASVTLLLATGCTSMRVTPVPADLNITHVCIEENPRVIVRGFEQLIIDGFQRHGIEANFYRSERLPDMEECPYLVSYVAYRKWDIVPYLSDAVVELRHNGKRVGYANFHLRGGGGLDLGKFSSNTSKIRPLMDKLLRNYPFIEGYEPPKKKERMTNRQGFH